MGLTYMMQPRGRSFGSLHVLERWLAFWVDHHAGRHHGCGNGSLDHLLFEDETVYASILKGCPHGTCIGSTLIQRSSSSSWACS